MYPVFGFGPMHSLIGLMFFGFFTAVISIVVLIPHWVIFKKAGFSPFLALLLFLPVINILILYVVAFSRWNVVPANMVYPAGPPVPYRPPV